MIPAWVPLGASVRPPRAPFPDGSGGSVRPRSADACPRARMTPDTPGRGRAAPCSPMDACTRAGATEDALPAEFRPREQRRG